MSERERILAISVKEDAPQRVMLLPVPYLIRLLSLETVGVY